MLLEKLSSVAVTKNTSNNAGFSWKNTARASVLSSTIEYLKTKKKRKKYVKAILKSGKQLGGREAAWVTRRQSRGFASPLRNSL